VNTDAEGLQVAEFYTKKEYEQALSWKPPEPTRTEPQRICGLRVVIFWLVVVVLVLVVGGAVGGGVGGWLATDRAADSKPM
jgi:hypothetical protein